MYQLDLIKKGRGWFGVPGGGAEGEEENMVISYT